MAPYQIPRQSLIWILASLTAVILPHVTRMPLWLTVLCAACIAARILIFQGRLSYPGNKTKVTVVVVTLAAVLLQYGSDVFSTESTVAILIVGIALKLLEMRDRRDVLLVIYLCYFTVVAEFIYSQSIPMTFYMGMCVVLITAGLLSLHQTPEGQRPRRTFRLSAGILLQSVPVMLALFLLFPRITPLWSMPVRTNGGVTGLSENMSPGDIGQLTRSGDVAFRVQFEGEPPPYNELYWRGLTLDLFDGREWTRRRNSFDLDWQNLDNYRRETENWFARIEYLGQAVDYDVILEPTNQNWIFTLKMPRLREDGLYMRRDYQVASRGNITQRYSYSARSFLRHRASLQLAGDIRRRALLLPVNGNEESRAWARRLLGDVGSNRAYIEAVLEFFSQEEFFYTLSPGELGRNSIDEFLFNTREGFCEHYASAFTYLMRVAGIPARVVTGYQGGEFNPYNDTLIVRQYDAHAWSEVWLEGEGWVRIDPTAAVAPQRINMGSDVTFQTDENFLEDEGFSMLLFRNYLLLNELRLRLETIGYAWNRWVLNYDEGMQFQLFSRLFGTATRGKILFTLLGAVVMSLAVAAYIILRQPAPRERDQATTLYLRYCDMLARAGLARRNGETPADYCARVSRRQPAWAGEAAGITRTYMDIAYRGVEDERKRRRKLRELKNRIRRFRLLK